MTVSADAADHALSDCLHPGRQASIQLSGVTVGILGEVHPRVTKAFKLKRVRPVYFEIERDALLTPRLPVRFQERSVHQPILRSLAFSLPPKVTAGEVAATLTAAGPPWLDAVDMVDLFEHEQDGIAMRAVTFALRYANNDGNRSADDVNRASEALIVAVDTALGPRGVSLRA